MKFIAFLYISFLFSSPFRPKFLLSSSLQLFFVCFFVIIDKITVNEAGYK